MALVTPPVRHGASDAPCTPWVSWCGAGRGGLVVVGRHLVTCPFPLEFNVFSLAVDHHIVGPMVPGVLEGTFDWSVWSLVAVGVLARGLLVGS